MPYKTRRIRVKVLGRKAYRLKYSYLRKIPRKKRRRRIFVYKQVRIKGYSYLRKVRYYVKPKLKPKPKRRVRIKKVRVPKKPIRGKWIGWIDFKQDIFIPSVESEIMQMPNPKREFNRFRASLNNVRPIAVGRWAVHMPTKYVSPIVGFKDVPGGGLVPVVGSQYGIPKTAVNWVNISFIVRYPDGRYGYENIFLWIVNRDKHLRVAWKWVNKNIDRYIKAAVKILTGPGEKSRGKRSPRGVHGKSGSAAASRLWFLFWESYYKPIFE